MIVTNNRPYVESSICKEFNESDNRFKEFCVSSSSKFDKDGNPLALGIMSAALLEKDRINIGGVVFVGIELTRKRRVGNSNFTQAYFRVRCTPSYLMDEGSVSFETKFVERGMTKKRETYVRTVFGFLENKGVRKGMRVAEIYHRNTKRRISIEDIEAGKEYRFTFVYDYDKQLLSEKGQVYVKMERESKSKKNARPKVKATSKAVLIERWEYYALAQRTFTGCLAKRTNKQFGFGMTFGVKNLAIPVLESDEKMKKFFAAIELFECRFCYFIKRQNDYKFGSASKITFIILMPRHISVPEQIEHASKLTEYMTEHVTGDWNLECITSEIAEVVTLRKHLSEVYTAVLVVGHTCDYIMEQAKKYEDSKVILSCLQEIQSKTYDVDFDHAFTDLQSVRQCSQTVEERLQDSWVCDLELKPELSEYHLHELKLGSEFLRDILEQAILRGGADVVSFASEFLLGKMTLEQASLNPKNYNRNQKQTWSKAIRWWRFHAEKAANLKKTKEILRKTWRKTYAIGDLTI